MHETPISRFKPLETDRLILRPLEAQDTPCVFQLYADWNVAQTLSRITFPFIVEAAQRFGVEAQSAYQQGTVYTLGIFQRAGGACVGLVSLRVPSRDPGYPKAWRIEDPGLGILGYAIRTADWHQGFATESAGRMIAFAFDGLGLARL